MKLIWAVVRPERERDVIEQLGRAGVHAFTRLDVTGRGRQRGLVAGTARYDELAKVWIMLVVEDDLVDRAVDTLRIAACTGNAGDGKIFVAPLAEARTIRPARVPAAGVPPEPRA
jgi:nitrogen regulatory protein PII 1